MACDGPVPALRARVQEFHLLPQHVQRSSRLGFHLHLPLNAALSISPEPYLLLQRSLLNGSDRQLMMMLTLQWADLFTFSVVRRKVSLQHKPILLLGSCKILGAIAFFISAHAEGDDGEGGETTHATLQ